VRFNDADLGAGDEVCQEFVDAFLWDGGAGFTGNR
jgi:hypothetical protein